MKYIILCGLFLSLSSFAQETESYSAPDVEMASETVAVPDMLEPLSAEPVTPTDATADAPDFEETPAPTIPAVQETLSEAEEKKVVTQPIPKTSTPVLSTEVDEDKGFDIYKSHWNTLFNFETVSYPTPFKYKNNNGGKLKKEINEPDLDMYGGRLGFGRDFYIGAGLNTTSRVEAYYMGSLFAKTKEVSVSDTASTPASTSKNFGSLYGVDASQSLGWSFDFKTKNPFMDEITYLVVEPFVEAGIGVARATTHSRFESRNASGLDKYSHRVNDNLANARIGGGVNMTSKTGFYFFMRATLNRYEVINRKQKIIAGNDGNINKVDDSGYDDKFTTPLMIYALGGGYKF